MFSFFIGFQPDENVLILNVYPSYFVCVPLVIKKKIGK